MATRDRIALSLLLLTSLAIQFSVRTAGFEALSADDFGRVIVAALWVRDPQPIWHGVWLPLHTYLVGSLIWLTGELLWTPRLLNMLLGVLSLVLIYHLAHQLFQRKLIALLSVSLLLINPGFIWLALTPLTELQYTTLILGSLVGLCSYVQTGRSGPLYLGTACLALASTLRFEAWVLIALLGGALAGAALLRARARQPPLVLAQLIALMVLAVFPLSWMLGNYVITGDALYFLEVNRNFDRTFYGTERNYWAYGQVLFALDPLGSGLALLAFPALIIGAKPGANLRLYLWLTLGSLVGYIILRAGYVQPPGNYIRYLAPFLFLLYPMIAWLIITLAERLPTLLIRRGALLALGLVWLALQLPAAFRFTNDPSVAGLQAGMVLNDLRAATPESAPHPVLIELNYWQYLALHVATSDLSYIFYDRALDFQLRNNSETTLDAESLVRCLHEHHMRYAVFRDPELRRLVTGLSGVELAGEAGGYQIYRINPEQLAPPTAPTPLCSLPVGTGY